MPITSLRDDNVQSLPIKEGSRDVYYWDSHTNGFGVRVYYNGNRVYVVKYQNSQGTQSLKTLGPVDAISLQKARSAAQYRRRKAAEVAAGLKHGVRRVRGNYVSRDRQEIQCTYTKEGVHYFRTKDGRGKYCSQAHYHLDYGRTYYDDTATKTIKENPTVTHETPTPDVIYLPDETQERTSDIALLQHQLDEMNQNIQHIVEDKVNKKLQLMLETLTGNLVTLFTSKLVGDK